MSALQNALAAINSVPIYDDSKELISAKCRALMAGYHERWHTQQYVPLDVEVVLESPIVNPETNRQSRTLSQAGKLDVIALHGERTVLIDHKTCSQDIADPDSPYWRQLVVESQVSHYMLLGWLNGRKFDDAVWDVIRKPTISPKKITKAEKVSVVADGMYHGRLMGDGSRYSLQTEDRETLEMYEARLARDCTNVRPEWYFQRRSVPRFDGELLEYAGELWMHSKDILHERKRELPVRNSGACMLYGSPCVYLGVCSGHDTIDSDKWARKENVHNELEIDDGRNVVTNSRIRCFQTCRRKHFYQYELGIERVDAEDKEALYFGSLMHVALESWFTTYLEETENVNNSTATEVVKHDDSDAIYW